MKEKEKKDIFEPDMKTRIRIAVEGLAIGLVVWWLAYGSVYFLPVAPAAAAVFCKVSIKEVTDGKKREFLIHFAEFVRTLHSSMRSGYSLENAVDAAGESLSALYGENALICTEIKRISSGMKLGRTPEEMFSEMGGRCRLEDVMLFAELIKISRRSGGSMGKLLSDTSRVLEEKASVEAQIQEQLAGKQMEQNVMSVMPALIILYVRLCFSGFTDVLYGTAAGEIVMSVCLGIYAAAWIWGVKMVDIKV